MTIEEQQERNQPPAMVFPATSAPLLAGSFLIEAACKKANDDFMICKHRNGDPSACVQYAQSVIDCSHNVFESIRKSPCQKVFERFWRCLDMNNQDHIYCRPEEFALLDCSNEHLGLKKLLWKGDRPEKGFKEEMERPEINSIMYKLHVLTHKN